MAKANASAPLSPKHSRILVPETVQTIFIENYPSLVNEARYEAERKKRFEPNQDGVLLFGHISGIALVYHLYNGLQIPNLICLCWNHIEDNCLFVYSGRKIRSPESFLLSFHEFLSV